VFVKGADSSMIKMCVDHPTDQFEAEAEAYACEGLRTLVFGYKKLDGLIRKGSVQPGASDWDGVKPEEVENGLTLIAVTAVEDLLQEEVSECI
jgi:magnesium-transporting ATPase (P-type)